MRTILAALFTLISTVAVPTLTAQTFNSGSNGSDGALNLTNPGTIIFDPKSFNPPLNPAGDNIFNFTTITIGAGVTVRLSSQQLTGPVFWLTQGPIVINGTIDLNGGDGSVFTGNPADRILSIPGGGGYSGGLGSFGSFSDQPGNGPGGGGFAGQCQFGGPNSGGGSFTGNQFLVPLIGGSGGAGRQGGGGAGGGALLLASSSSITLTGAITANGGKGSGGGGGSGGGVRLAAVTIAGNGSIFVNAGAGGSVCGLTGGGGQIRLEAFTFNDSLNTSPVAIRSTPFNTFVPTNPPAALRVASVAGVPVPPSPTGSFVLPDVTINSSAAVSFIIQAQNVPLGTVVTLRISSENGADMTVNSSALAGTLASSTATASAVLPSGFSRGYVKATWTQ